MEILNKTMYWISTGLMLPVVVILILLFMRALLALGGFYGTYLNRLKRKKTMDTYLERISGHGFEQEEIPSGQAVIWTYLGRLRQALHSPVNREKVLADFELEMAQQLALTKSMSKLGPVLGLMGTLIPMGPALVGLASGNIASMAENMQVAFSTTVVGLIVGAIGYILTEVKQRWYAKDLSQLNYIADLITENHEKTEQ